jgi:mannose-1-phosphate guanylyltransferase
MVVHADNLSRFNVGEFLDSHRLRPQGSKITMMTFRTDSPSSCGIVICDKEGLVTEFYEKKVNPPGNLANGAVYIIDADVVDFISALPEKKYPLEFISTVLPHFIGKINTFHNYQFHRDIGTPESYRLAELTYRF